MDDFEIEIKKTFLDEASSTLEETESAFLDLDNEGDKTETLSRIFRLAHSFKGSAKAVGFDEVSHLAHKMEDLLVVIQKDQSLVSKAVNSALLKTVDVLKIMIQGLKSDFNFSHPIESIVNELVAIKDNPRVGSEPVASFSTEMSSESLSLVPSESPMEPQLDSKKLSEDKKSSSPGASISKAKVGSPEEDSLRISVRKLDTLLNFVGELVVQKSIVDQMLKEGVTDLSEINSVFSYMSKLVSEVQQISMGLRMVPIKPLFQRLKRTLRDIAQVQNKTVQFESMGEDVELDKVILDRMIDPLTHIIRNSVDHGIESDIERIELGKKEPATVYLQAVQENNVVKIIIVDNGRGLNKKRILEKALTNNLITQDQASVMAEKEIYKLIFLPGFSTKEVVTEISGRGVGMDVVLKTVRELDGSVDIHSIEGVGSQFEISIPLSHAILGGITIRIDDSKYIVPLPHLVETISFNNVEIHHTKNNERVLNLRGEIIPVIDLTEALRFHNNHGSKSRRAYDNGIIVSFEGQKFCFEIDSIIGQQEVVIKHIGDEIGALPGIIGAGIIGSGEVSLILNLKDFCQKGGRYGRFSA